MFCALFKTLDIMRVFLSGSSPPLCRQLSFVMDTSTSLLASKSPSIFVVRSTKLGQVIVVCVYTRQLSPTAPRFLLYGFGFTRWEMMTTAQRQQQFTLFGSKSRKYHYVILNLLPKSARKDRTIPRARGQNPGAMKSSKFKN